MENENITVIAIEPGKKPYVQEIQSGLESLQKEVGGDIQAVYPYEDAVAIICAEEGKLMGMPFNRALRDEDGHIYDILVGKFLLVGLGEDNFVSMPENLMQKYMEMFDTPEQLVKIGPKNHILPAMDTTPLYTHTATFARFNDELPQYRESLKANIACKEAIEKAINDNYYDWRLNTQFAEKLVAAQFPVERIRYVLAATVQQKSWDGRISDANKAWADTIPVADEENRLRYVVDQCHSGLTNLFINRFREEKEKKPSIMEKLSTDKQTEPTPKTPSAPKKPKSKGPEL